MVYTLREYTGHKQRLTEGKKLTGWGMGDQTRARKKERGQGVESNKL